MLEENNNHHHNFFEFPIQQSRILAAIVQRSILNLLHPYLKFQFRLIDLSQSNIQMLYGLQINNEVRQFVNKNWTGFFKNKFVVHGQYIRFCFLDTTRHFNLSKMVALLCK